MRFEASSLFHFAEPSWLFLLLLPLAIAGFYRFYKVERSLPERLSAFADSHLLPHLIRSTGTEVSIAWPRLWFWTVMWCLAVLALAGPRWAYHDVTAYKRDASLVILLDVSASMRVQDALPSRMERARQEVDDIIKANRDGAYGIHIGAVAFAAIPHILVPVTEDMEVILELLPHVDTSLVNVQGSQIADAFQTAEKLLRYYPGKNRHILLVTDGDIEEQAYTALRDTISKSEIPLSILTLGTEKGEKIPDADGRFIVSGQAGVVRSALKPDYMQSLAEAGRGQWIQASFLSDDTSQIIQSVVENAGIEESLNQQSRVWEERFDIFLWPLLLALIPVFRRQRGAK